MNKMDGMSMNLIGENVEQLKRLFPEAVTEGKIDFEVLKALLGGEIETRQEYYKFTWNGKEAARAYARTRSMGTLRPCVEESSGKDGTPGKFDSENLYIEGDNLEVLKLLQGAYHKKVKMIYIDPPYNTGKDFVYPDNYRDSIKNYKELTGQADAEGKSTRANPETSGRYHTDWLNMMYPRLILARNLLTDDGVIFISIDDSEQDNLKKLCNEVFGEENFVAQLIWKSRQNKDNRNLSGVSIDHEYIVVYSKNTNIRYFIGDKRDTAQYSNPDNDPRGDWCSANMAGLLDASQRPNCHFDLINPQTGINYGRPKMGWRYDKHTMARLIDEKRILWPNNAEGRPRRKVFLSEITTLPGFSSIVGDKIFTRIGSNELDLFFKTKFFDFPKPSMLIKEFILQCSTPDSIIFDFFSGSATTAHAVMKLNAEDGGNRKFIMVQLPEPCEEGTEAAKAGYKNICEIGKERIRRAAKKIREENPLACQNQDMGFKVFKLDTSNLLPWNPNAETLAQDLYKAVDNVLADRSTDDLLYEILLKCNLPLTLPIEKKQFGGNTVYIVGMGALAICLDKTIPAPIADEIVKLRDEYAPIVPMQVVFRDNGFDDVSKTNALQILKQAGFEDKSIQTI